MWEPENDAVEVAITEEEYALAEEWGESLGELKNSITNGKHNYVGRLGELIVARVTGGEIKDDYEYDILSPTGERLEVKTKATSKRPLPFYDCSVCAHNATQRCDAYVFVRVSYDRSKPTAWICGRKDRESFFKNATFHRKGEVDPRNKFTFHTDCYNMEIKYLEPLV